MEAMQNKRKGNFNKAGGSKSSLNSHVHVDVFWVLLHEVDRRRMEAGTHGCQNDETCAGNLFLRAVPCFLEVREKVGEVGLYLEGLLMMVTTDRTSLREN